MKIKHTLLTAIIMTFMNQAQASESFFSSSNPNEVQIMNMMRMYEDGIASNLGNTAMLCALYTGVQTEIAEKMTSKVLPLKEGSNLIFGALSILCGRLSEQDNTIETIEGLVAEYVRNLSMSLQARIRAVAYIKDHERYDEAYALVSSEIAEEIRSGEVSQEEGSASIFQLLKGRLNQSNSGEEIGDNHLVLEYVHNLDMHIFSRYLAVDLIRNETEKNAARIFIASEILRRMEAGEGVTEEDGKSYLGGLFQTIDNQGYLEYAQNQSIPIALRFYFAGKIYEYYSGETLKNQAYEAIAVDRSISFDNRIKAAEKIEESPQKFDVYKIIQAELLEAVRSGGIPQKEGSELILSLIPQTFLEFGDQNNAYSQYIKNSSMDLDCRLEAVKHINGSSAKNKQLLRNQAYEDIFLDPSINIEQITAVIRSNSAFSTLLGTKFTQINQLVLNAEPDVVIRLIHILCKLGNIDMNNIKQMTLNAPMSDFHRVKMIEWLENNSPAHAPFVFSTSLSSLIKLIETKTPWVELLQRKATDRDTKIQIVGALNIIASSKTNTPIVRVKAAYFLSSLGRFSRPLLNDLIPQHRNGMLKELCEELENDVRIDEVSKADIRAWKAELTKPV